MKTLVRYCLVKKIEEICNDKNNQNEREEDAMIGDFKNFEINKKKLE